MAGPFFRKGQLFSLIKTSQSCPIDFKLGIMMTITFRQDLISVDYSIIVTTKTVRPFETCCFNLFILYLIILFIYYFGIMIPGTIRYNILSQASPYLIKSLKGKYDNVLVLYPVFTQFCNKSVYLHFVQTYKLAFCLLSSDST